MQQIDPTVYTCFCSLCSTQIDASKDIPTIDTGEIFILCENCYESLRIFVKNRTLEELEGHLGVELEKEPEFSKYHPRHRNIAHLTKLAEKTYTACNCCGKELVNRPVLQEKNFKLRKALEIFKRKHGLEFDVCDDCLKILVTLETLSKTEEAFIMAMHQTFKYPPRKK